MNPLDAAGDLTFAAPARLWLLVPLVAALALTPLVLRLLRRHEEPYADAELMDSVAPHRAGWRRPLAAAGLALATVALTTAFARPQVLAENAKDRAVVMIALDTSTSMLATDVSPDRFTAAKTAAKAFIRELPAQIDVGLVGYNVNAVLAAAPTSEHERVAAAVDKLTMSGGTAMGDALTMSLRAVLQGAQSGGGDPAARIVLLSDGDSTTGSPLADAVTAAADAKVPVSTIAYGTQDGIVVANGRTYHVPVNKATLQGVADGTGGIAYDAASAVQLDEVYADIGSQLVKDTARQDVADLVAGGALALLLLTAVPSLAWFARLA
jgi:Ca-activated chloride channel family protein